MIFFFFSAFGAIAKEWDGRGEEEKDEKGGRSKARAIERISKSGLSV